MKLSLKRSFLLFSFFFCFCFFSASTFSYAMVIAPSTINLNAECIGMNQDIQAIIRWPSNFYFTIGDNEISLTINSKSIEADSLRYCFDDDNFLISFSRSAIQEALEDLSFDGSKEKTLQVEVYGTIDITYDDVETFTDGETFTVVLDESSSVTIIKPGKKNKK